MIRRTNLRRMSPVTLAGLCILSLPTATAAQEGQSTNSHIEAIKACQSETDSNARLACFDAAAASIVGATEAGDLRIVNRDEVRKTRRKLFGFSLPDLGIFGKSDDEDEEKDEIHELETTLAGVSGSHSTGYFLRTEEGAVWQIDDVPRRLLEPRVGDKLLIKSGALSAYFIRINGQGGVKARRVR